MVNFRSLVAALVGISTFAQDAIAHSTQRNPLRSIYLLQDPTINTPSKRAHYHSSFDLRFTLPLHDGPQEIRLALEPNHDLLHESTHITYLRPDGTVRAAEQIQRHEHKVYRGRAFARHKDQTEWTNAGWARVTLHRDGKHPIFEGAFRVLGNSHHIQTGSNYRRLKHAADPEAQTNEDPDELMVVWRDSDVLDSYFDSELKRRDDQGQVSCHTDTLEFNAKYDPFALDTRTQAVSPASLFGRQIEGGQTGDDGAGWDLRSSIGNKRGCPTIRKIALIGVATDCTYTADFNSTQSARENIIAQVNSASEVYESSFNISLGIQNVTISEAQCPGTPNDAAKWNIGCSSSTSISDRLSLFSEWRGRFNDNNAFWTLLTKCPTGPAVGLAWLGQVCVSGARPSGEGSTEMVSSANVVVRTPSEWQVIAHEAGHTFGAVHDCDQELCATGQDANGVQKCCPLSSGDCDAKGRFIMNPSTGSDIETFSPCSVGNVCSALFRNAIQSNCLSDNRNVKTISGQQCGNGIVEEGEDCDCGGTEACGDNPCCNPTTCKFTEKSVCDPSNADCCTPACQLASQGTVCRASTGDCDPEETCRGDSSICPDDKHKNDGDGCGQDGQGLKCASGQCTSRDQQCQSALGTRNTANSDTEACDNGCLLHCKSPKLFETDQCRVYAQPFLDGTNCENGGKCSNGVCEGGSVFNNIGDFWQKNKHILVPVIAGVGGLIAIAILWCCINSYRRRNKARKAAKQNPTPPPMQMWNSYGGGNGGGGGAGGWNHPQSPNAYGYPSPVNNNNSNNNNAHQQPLMQPHTHHHQQHYASYQQGQGQGQGQQGGWQVSSRSMSNRYA